MYKIRTATEQQLKTPLTYTIIRNQQCKLTFAVEIKKDNFHLPMTHYKQNAIVTYSASEIQIINDIQKKYWML